jgi:hypothetical protein
MHGKYNWLLFTSIASFGDVTVVNLAAIIIFKE